MTAAEKYEAIKKLTQKYLDLAKKFANGDRSVKEEMKIVFAELEKLHKEEVA